MINRAEPNQRTGLEIAVIGMAARFPGAKNTEQFWRILREGVNTVTFFTDEELLSAGVAPGLLREPNYVKARGMVEGVDLFDAAFFGLNPREAEIMDPQHRFFLECSQEALEHAGYNSEACDERIGVYASVGLNTYLLNNLIGHHRLKGTADLMQALIGNDKDHLSTRVSYKLNLEGPSVTVQTACSSSLVALHLACQGLLSGDCDIALTGGVTIRVPARSGYLYQEGMAFSPDGYCRAFDAKAQGTVDSSGVGIVVLKRLEEAIADRDCIHAVIKGSAINNDGALKIGYTAPRIDGQARVIRNAQVLAEVDAETISYVEAHGTGTPLGDPIEIAALTQAFRITTHKKGFCAIGSVKTNIGHTDTAAGVAGFIKTVLALKHKQIPPSLNFQSPNPKIDFANTPFFVNESLRSWGTESLPRRASVSSFGLGGTNAHVILEEAPPAEPSQESRPHQLLILSAKTATALEKSTANLIDYLKEHPDADLSDVAYTLKVGRAAFTHRRMVTCTTVADAIGALESLGPQRVFTSYQEPCERPVIFMFPGGGTQHLNMGLELYKHEAVFRDHFDQCAELLKPILGFDLREVSYPGEQPTAELSEQFERTSKALPALFATEYALAKLLMSWGIRPQGMIGHSLGEYTAACLSGVISLEDALKLVALRGQLIEQLPPGSMLSVMLSEQEVLPLLPENLSLAAVNGPSLCVVSGLTEDIAKFEVTLTKKGINYHRLHISAPGHSRIVEPILDQITAFAEGMRLSEPQIPYLSNVTGTWITTDVLNDKTYWAKHLRQTVKYADGLAKLFKEPETVLIEVGPGQSLSALARQHPAKSTAQVIINCMRHPREIASDESYLQAALGRLWLAGVKLDWRKYYAGEKRNRVELPTYPFERASYWINPPEQTKAGGNLGSSLGTRRELDEWFYMPSWKRTLRPLQYKPGDLAARGGRWLVFVDEAGVGEQIVSQLRNEGQQVITLHKAAEFLKESETAYRINPGERQDYERVMKDLRASEQTPTRVAHLWNVERETGEDPADNWRRRYVESQERGYYSLINLAQALGEHGEDVEIWVVTSGMQEVGGERQLRAEKATVLGPCKVIPREFANLRCASVDVVLSEGAREGAEEIAAQLMAEFKEPASGTEVAYRGKHRWVRSYENISLKQDSVSKTNLREGGTYLITGGVGGIGLELAEYLAREARANLILTGRREIPGRDRWDDWLKANGDEDETSKIIAKIRRIEESGGHVLVATADVTDEQQMRSALMTCQERFGAINGVIHAAGVLNDSIIPLKTRELTNQVLAPKVEGTLVLDRLFEDADLDFFILFSSISSITGPIGQADYCAANAFLDAFANHNANRNGKPIVSVNWDRWHEAGRAVNIKSPYRLENAEAVSVDKSVSHPLFDRCLVETESQQVYLTEFSVNKHWVLDEHRLVGRAVVPGTTYLEMARAAFERHQRSGAIEIRDLFFVSPLVVSDDEKREVYTILTKDGSEHDFAIVSRSGGGIDKQHELLEHAVGKIAEVDGEIPRVFQISDLTRNCNLEERCEDDSRINVDAESRRAYFGPRWQSLKQTNVGNGQLLARLELDEEFSDDLERFSLHPALMDMATSS
ncbi:MAG TPA: type I polyketide synthase, partial [Blastocatellia bacterium]